MKEHLDKKKQKKQIIDDLDRVQDDYRSRLEETERLKRFRARKLKELKRRKRNRRIVITVLTVLLLVIIGGGAYIAVREYCPDLIESLLIWQNEHTGEDDTETSPALTEESTEEETTEEPTTEEQTTEPTTPEPTTEPPDPREDVWEHYNNMFIASKLTNYLNVRDQPTMDGKIIGKLVKYAGGELLEDLGNGWYHIRSGEIDGFIAAEYCVTGEEAKQIALEHCFEMVEVTAERLNVRSGPGEEYGVWTQLSASEKLVVEAQEGAWLKISINSSSGYIHSDYTKTGFYLVEAMPWSSISNYSPTRQALFAYAEQFLGTKYVFGGTDLHNGIDCSSYVQQCFRNAIGIELQRTSRDQVKQGAAITMAEAKPGDLLFYADENQVVNHVAMYLGDGKILHAAQSFGQIIISKYNYATEPVAVRNVIGE